MTKELLVLFATICINCAMFLASAEAARFGSSGYFLTMDVPVFLEQAETMGYPTVAKFANQDDGSIFLVWIIRNIEMLYLAMMKIFCLILYLKLNIMMKRWALKWKVIS